MHSRLLLRDGSPSRSWHSCIYHYNCFGGRRGKKFKPPSTTFSLKNLTENSPKEVAHVEEETTEDIHLSSAESIFSELARQQNEGIPLWQ